MRIDLKKTSKILFSVPNPVHFLELNKNNHSVAPQYPPKINKYHYSDESVKAFKLTLYLQKGTVGSKQ